MRIRCTAFAIFSLLSFIATIRADVTESDFGDARDGAPVRLFTITNASGSSARIMTYGAALVSLKVPDHAGKLDDIILGYDSIDGYLANDPYFGAIVGRYANRIHAATFTLDNIQFKLPANDHGNTLHGGRRGFDKVLWTGTKIDDHSVEFTYISKDGEQGFPGNLTARVRYSLSDSNELTIDYSATTDKDTVVNLANHTYFNLTGAGNGNILNHELSINADQFTPTDAHGIPTGQLLDVANTPFDFRQPHKIGERIDADNQQLHFGNGYDHNFVLTPKDGMRLAATVFDPTTGRTLEISTDQPGIQFYSGNGLDGSITGKLGETYEQYAAFCLEPQHFPDSPNQPDFPSTELKPGQTYHTTTLYKFTTRPPTTPAPPSISLATGWTLLQEGEAQGTIEQDAAHPSNADPHLLRITETKSAGPGEGRVGATSDIHFPVQNDEWCDITFSAVTRRASIGLVFSLENPDGKVLARTTLPEIGGRPRGRRSATTAPIVWNKYRVALHVRDSDPNVHVVITPIEPTDIWLDNLALTPRQTQK